MNALLDPLYLFQVFLLLLGYLPATLGLSAICILTSLALGFVVAIITTNKVPVLSPICKGYILIIRACPLMIQLYLVYFGLPTILLAMGKGASIGSFSPFAYAVVALTINYAAYISEVLRSSLLAVDKGQMEAALSIGMSWFQSLRRIVLVQAGVFAIPPLTGQFLRLIKGTAIVFTISVVELMAGAKLHAAESYRYFEVYIVVALMYWGICGGVEALMQAAARKTSKFIKG